MSSGAVDDLAIGGVVFSLHQDHLLGQALAVGVQRVEVGATGHGTGVEVDAV